MRIDEGPVTTINDVVPGDVFRAENGVIWRRMGGCVGIETCENDTLAACCRMSDSRLFGLRRTDAVILLDAVLHVTPKVV